VIDDPIPLLLSPPLQLLLTVEEKTKQKIFGIGVALKSVGSDGCGKRPHIELCLNFGKDCLYCEDRKRRGKRLGYGSCRHIR